MVVDWHYWQNPATLPARNSSMVSKLVTDKPAEAGDDPGGGFRHWESGRGSRAQIKSPLEIQSDSHSLASDGRDFGRDFFTNRRADRIQEAGFKNQETGFQLRGVDRWASGDLEDEIVRSDPQELTGGDGISPEDRSIDLRLQEIEKRMTLRTQDLDEKVCDFEVGSRSHGVDQRGSKDEERQLQDIKEKMLGIINEMRGMFKEWRREDAARKAAESTVLDRSLPVLYPTKPTAQSSSLGINAEPISPPTFDSATVWDVDDDGEEDELLNIGEDVSENYYSDVVCCKESKNDEMVVDEGRIPNVEKVDVIEGEIPATDVVEQKFKSLWLWSLLMRSMCRPLTLG